MDFKPPLNPFAGSDDAEGVRKILVRGIFWRILIIEGILLVWSLFYSFVTGEHDSPQALIWYAFRIIVLIGIIIAFIVVTFRSFLTKKIISPLESIVEANRRLQNGDAKAKVLHLPEDTPKEIREISSTRTQMLDEIFKVSEERLRLVNFIRETFGRYLSEKVVDKILESPEGQKIGGLRQLVTVLMSDLRGFTGLSETLAPELIVNLLNRYFGRMSDVILQYEGVIDEFVGDSILAVFGIPEVREDDALRAVACGVAMQNALAKLNQDFLRDGHPSLEMGIGINTGSVIVGNIGSEKRLKYGIVGAAVNIAARIESNTTGGQVLIGESTYQTVRDRVESMSAHTVKMKGLKQPLVYFPVIRVGPPYDIALNPQIEVNGGVSIELPFRLWLLEKKRILEAQIQGATLRIGDGAMKVKLEEAVQPLTDVKFKFDFCLDAHCFEDIYAKVIDVEKKESEWVAHLRVTAIQPSDKALLERWKKEGAP